jgi:hypothetical protein
MSVRTRRPGRLLQPGVPPGGGSAPCAAGFCYKTPIVNPFCCAPIFDFDSQSDTLVTLIRLRQRDKVRGRAAPRGFPRRAMMQSWAFSSSASIICDCIA